jgi:hypothetical protein
MAADFFKRRAHGARPEDLKAFLAMVPDVPPEPGDELPDQANDRPASGSAKKPRIGDPSAKRARRR